MKMRGLLAATLAAGCAAIADVVLPPEQAAQLGAQMAQRIEAQQGLHEFSFKVLEAPGTVNAFALPGGQIYVTSGLVALAGSDALLASVLAHEVAHVAERHIAERLAAQYGAKALAGAALGQDPGIIASLAGSVLQQGALMKYSRSQELEADRRGLAYLQRAGFDPQAAISMFRNLAGAGGGGEGALGGFFASHPGEEERIARLQRTIGSQPRR